MKQHKYIAFLIMLFVGVIAHAQASFTATVSKKSLGVNERLRVDFKMNKDGDDFVPPSFSGFDIIGGPNQSVSHSWINGKRSFNKTYSYFLAPNKQGKFSIKPASINIDDKTYYTKPIDITITKATAQGNGSGSQAINDKIHLVAIASKTSPYLNEGITVEYRLYVSPTTGIRNTREVVSPKYNGFWSQAIDLKNEKVKRGEYKGEDYRYIVLKRTVLYPQKTGKLILEPLKLNITVDIPSGQRDFFGRSLSRPVNKIFTASKKVINVKPLPLANQPEDFNGAVGKFDFAVTKSKEKLKAGESLQLKIKVSGKGNLKLFELPKPSLSPTLEVYDPEHNEKVRTTYSGIQGTVIDNYTIVPQNKGSFPLNTITFSYFDPAKKEYVQLSSNLSPINVHSGPEIDNNAAINTPSENIITATDNDFASISQKTTLKPINKGYFFNSKPFWSILLTLLLSIPLAIFIKKQKALNALDVVGNKSKKANKLARKYLGEAKKNLSDKKEFYISLEKALHNYLKAKLKIETSELSKDKIEELLMSHNVEVSTINSFLTLLQNCDQARYAPVSEVTINDDYNSSVNTIAAIDKTIR